MVTITRFPQGVPGETVLAFERVVRDMLGGAGEPVEVQLGTWPAEDGRLQFVCRVEGPPADPFAPEPQWRWWSPLLDGPEALRDALRATVHARRARGRQAADAPPPAAACSF
jgi:hypothetical protein